MRSLKYKFFFPAALIFFSLQILSLSSSIAEAHPHRSGASRHVHIHRHHVPHRKVLRTHRQRGRHHHVMATRRHSGSAAASVVAEAKRWVGHRNMTGTRGPWCADFTQWVLRRTGHSTVASRLARDAVRAGRPLARPAVGAIMSMPHHTGFVVGVLGKGRVLLLSGNYGHRVGIGVYSTRNARFAQPVGNRSSLGRA